MVAEVETAVAMPHYCYVCESYKPNERFTGRGHARHICRACQRLPVELSFFESEPVLDEPRSLDESELWEEDIPF